MVILTELPSSSNIKHYNLYLLISLLIKNVLTNQPDIPRYFLQGQTGDISAACRLCHQMDFKMGAQYRDLGYKEVAPVLVKRKVDILTAMKQIVDVECVVIWQVTGSRPGNI